LVDRPTSIARAARMAAIVSLPCGFLRIARRIAPMLYAICVLREFARSLRDTGRVRTVPYSSIG